MSVAMGRLDPTYFTNVSAVSMNGDLGLSGRIDVADPLLTAALTTQIDAMSGDVDNPIIPVVFADDHVGLAHLNGFYWVTEMSTRLDPGTIDPNQPIGHPEWSATLRPVADRQAPRIESILETVFRTESTVMVAADSDAWHAIPSSWNVYDDGSGQDLVPDQPWDTETGEILYGSDETNTPPRRSISTWRCKPEDWYKGAATIERQWGDQLRLPVIGRSLGIGNPLDGQQWEISNGIIRLRYDVDGLGFLIQCFDGTSWESTTEITFRLYASPPLATQDIWPLSVAVLRNNPAEVRLRIIGTPLIVGAPPSVIDLRLRRGSSMIDVNWAIPNSTVGLGYPGEILFDPAPTWTTPTNAGRHGAADANGHILAQMTPEGTSNTVDTSWRTSIGFVVSGSPVNYTVLRNNYYAPSAEHVRIVGA
jgi:hypothetical protein